MRQEVDVAVRLCELAERALEDADIQGAIARAGRARKIVGPYAEAREAGVFVRATAAEVDALSLNDELRRAEQLASTAVIWADYCEADGRSVALAHLKWHEIREMQRRYRSAAVGFDWLERHLPTEPWAAPLKMRCANHMLSIGVHNADVSIAERGIKCGSAVRSMVADVDEVSAW